MDTDDLVNVMMNDPEHRTRHLTASRVARGPEGLRHIVKPAHPWRFRRPIQASGLRFRRIQRTMS